VNARALHYSTKASELRREFDRTFAEPQIGDTRLFEDLLAIRLGPDSYALRLSDVSGLFAEKKITRLPSRMPALIGIAAFRGAILPVYDLALLVGYANSATARWLAMAASEPAAFAFDAFEGHLRLSRNAIVAPEDQAGQSRGREVARTADRVRPIVHMPSILEAIKQQQPQHAPRKER
jgi:purine-binding chemotaxis protein CheW